MAKANYYFYLNPHDDYKCTKCPKCDQKTKLRKHCLMIHYEEKSTERVQLFSLNKSGKFCPHCNLIIGQKSEIEELLDGMSSQIGFVFNPSNYFVFGTMDRKDWVRGQKERISPKEMLKYISHFKDTWDFEIQPAGWYLD